MILIIPTLYSFTVNTNSKLLRIPSAIRFVGTFLIIIMVGEFNRDKGLIFLLSLIQ